MEIINLEKNLKEIFERQYIVPLYQRNFAWAEDEICLLLQDVYESYRKSKEQNYFIGSLVVLPRRNGDYEVIDGQQRLTTISLIAKILGFDWVKEPKLFYDSRPEVESFFASFYRTGNLNDVAFDHKVSHLMQAVDIIKETIINPDEKETKTLLNIGELEDFRKYFAENVILIRVEIPLDTDVANYFEIMNNRGEQLHKHEILKAKLLDSIKNEKNKHDKKHQIIFSNIWDACSQMDIPIQKLFSKVDRINYFGENYNDFSEVDFCDLQLKGMIGVKVPSGEIEIGHTINFILENVFENEIVNNEFDDVEDESDDKSIIDFPNFLMHIFKIKYNEIYKKRYEVDIPLNEKDLLDIFNRIKDEMSAMNFVSDLLFFRTVFDRFIIKASTDENEVESNKWSLVMPYKYVYDKNGSTSLKYKNTFEDQERIIKCLSMLQVTFRNKKYKNWLQTVLSWFKDSKEFNILPEDFQRKLDHLVLDYYNINFKEIKSVEPLYSMGTNTPHFLFNFIDYLYWVHKKNNLSEIKFDFSYRNSVEHHLPQSFRNKENNDWIDNLGNLCLVSKGSNSKMNNEDPKGKASINGKYNKPPLPPKQKVMYDLTNSENDWGINEIEMHYNDVVKLLANSCNILNKEDE